MKYLPFNALEVAHSVCSNILIGNKTIPQFMVMDYVNMLVDGWCLQRRFGNKDAKCKLCLLGEDSLRHLP
jgi:hypothetical protein